MRMQGVHVLLHGKVEVVGAGKERTVDSACD